MALLADGIVTGKTTLADVFFLVALILFALQALVLVRPPNDHAGGWPITALGLAFIAAGFLVL
jgi:hypothetical protein